MARKLKRGIPFHPDDVRAKIRATELVNRLQSHIFDGLELSMSQVSAISILLRKCVPDLTSTAVVADITHRYVVELPPIGSAPLTHNGRARKRDAASGGPTAFNKFASRPAARPAALAAHSR